MAIVPKASYIAGVFVWCVTLLPTMECAPVSSGTDAHNPLKNVVGCAAVPNASRIPCGVYETRKQNMHGDFDFGKACEVCVPVAGVRGMA